MVTRNLFSLRPPCLLLLNLPSNLHRHRSASRDNACPNIKAYKKQVNTYTDKNKHKYIYICIYIYTHTYAPCNVVHYTITFPVSFLHANSILIMFCSIPFHSILCYLVLSCSIPILLYSILCFFYAILAYPRMSDHNTCVLVPSLIRNQPHSDSFWKGRGPRINGSPAIPTNIPNIAGRHMRLSPA